MGSHRKYTPAQIAGEITQGRQSGSIEKQRMQRLGGRLAESTCSEYVSKIQFIRETARANGTTSLDQEWFSDFVQIILNHTGPDNAAKYKAAYLLWLTANRQSLNVELWKINSQTVEGARKEHTKMVRGAITWDKLMKVCEYALIAGVGYLVEGLLLVYCAGLRHAQLTSINVGGVSFPPYSDHAKVVCTEGNKGKCGKKESEIKTAFGAAAMLKKMVAGRGQTERLIKFWRESDAISIIQFTAAEEKWDPAFTWDGVHCIRYGMRQDLENDLQIQLAHEMTKGGWASEHICRKYGRE